MKLTYAEILRKNREHKQLENSEQYNIAIISNTTVIQLKDILELSLKEVGINAFIKIGDYDNIVQDSANYCKYNAVVIFWDAANFLGGIYNHSHQLDKEFINKLEDRIKGEIQLVLKNLKETPLVIFNMFTSNMLENSLLNNSAIYQLCVKLNDEIKNLNNNFITLDVDQIAGSIGYHNAINYRQFYTCKALYTTHFYQ
jgi:hypothetical protein